MSPSSSTFYAAWRGRFLRADVLREENGAPAEHLLQAVWQHQRLQRDRLQTLDARRVRVIHPGFISMEGGPDFRGAILQFNDEPPVSGDVEIDLRPGGWHAHGHDRNPAFKNVRLHVVWEAAPKSKPPAQPAILPLKPFLDVPLAELAAALENESLRSLPENLRGKCCAPLRELDPAALAGLLQQAARVRLETKAGQLLARARHVGWEQALWENLFRALGYKHNAWAMQTLAEGLPAWRNAVDSLAECQARLLGVAGLLPMELTRKEKSADTHLRRAWDFWWREHDALAGQILPRAAWKFHGLRPANHPQRRLALAAHWLMDAQFIARIENWAAAEIADKKLPDSLLEILQAGDDPFWRWHFTLKSARLKKPLPLLGEQRMTDLAINVILPWLWTRAKEGGNNEILREMERRFFAWPAAEDNSVLKLARQRLLGVSHAKILTTAAQQQGLMQIVRDFCCQSDAACSDCRFPELVRGWRASGVT